MIQQLMNQNAPLQSLGAMKFSVFIGESVCIYYEVLAYFKTFEPCG